MRFKTETKMRIQALKYRDGLENHQIAREMGISQTMIWQYIQGLEKQIEKGEITVADIVKSVNTLKIEGPKKVRKQEVEKKVDEMLAEQGITQKELSENVNALAEATSNVLAQGGIIKEQINGNQPDGGKELQIPKNKHNSGGRPKMVVEVDGEPINIKKPSKQSDYVLTIMGHIYDELVAGRLALKYYLMEDGVHELQFMEVRKK